MFGSKEAKTLWDAITGFGFVFEATDDPGDTSAHRDQVKSMGIWLLPLRERNDPVVMTMPLQALLTHPGAFFVGSVTKATGVDQRRWAISTLEHGWLYVIAVPTVEWDHLYAHRVYPPVKITPGFRGNFTVSLPPKGAGQLGHPGTNSQSTEDGGFTL